MASEPTPNPSSSSSSSSECVCFIGLDVGTQGAKGVLHDPATDEVVARASVSYDLLPTDVPGRAEQDPAVWMDAVRRILAELSAALSSSSSSSFRRLGGVGVSGQQHGVVALDASFEVVRPAKLWCDVEADAEARYFTERATETLGRPWNVPAGFSVPKILWTRTREPENYARTAHFVLPHDYVTWRLAGGVGPIATDAGDASGTGVFDPVSRTFSRTLCGIVDDDLYDKLPPVVAGPTDVVGYLDAKEWLPSVSSVVVDRPVPLSAGSGDNMCSALGVGCVAPGAAVLSLGTSGTVFSVSREPPRADSSVAAFCDATGRHLPLACVMSCTGVLRDVLRAFSSDDDDDDGVILDHEEASRRAEAVPAGCHGLILLPYLGGERTPDWPRSRGALLGVDPSNLRRVSDVGVVYRAAMEGVAYALRLALDETTATDDDDEDDDEGELLVVGGGARNPVWRRILADVLERTLRFPLETESAALGAAFQAGAAAARLEDETVTVERYVSERTIRTEDAVVAPRAATAEVYRRGYRRFVRSARRLYDDDDDENDAP